MKLYNSLIAIVAAASLSACGSQMEAMSTGNPESSNNSQSADTTPAPSVQVSASKVMVNDLETQLKSQASSKLTAEQIQAIVNTVKTTLSSANLSNSDDLKALIPAIIQGASVGVGTLNLSDITSKSGILALIGDTALTSLVNLSPESVSASLIQSVTKSLFANLNLAGVSSGNQATAASSIIKSILGQLSGKDFDVSSLQTVIESLASGSVLGLGNLGNSNAVLNTIVSSLGSGSLPGLTSLIKNLGSSNNATTTLANLIGAFTSGSNSGLSSVVAKLGGSNSTFQTLLTSLMNGIKNNAGSTGSSSTASTVVSIVGSLLSGFLNR
jgi:hypothetical protein